MEAHKRVVQNSGASIDNEQSKKPNKKAISKCITDVLIEYGSNTMHNKINMTCTNAFRAARKKLMQIIEEVQS